MIILQYHATCFLFMSRKGSWESMITKANTEGGLFLSNMIEGGLIERGRNREGAYF